MWYSLLNAVVHYSTQRDEFLSYFKLLLSSVSTKPSLNWKIYIYIYLNIVELFIISCNLFDNYIMDVVQMKFKNTNHRCNRQIDPCCIFLSFLTSVLYKSLPAVSQYRCLAIAIFTFVNFFHWCYRTTDILTYLLFHTLWIFDEH